VVREGLAYCRTRFEAAGLDEVDNKARLLVEEISGLPRLQLDLQGDHPLDGARLAEWVERACAREPIQHIMGYVEFMDLKIKTDARALIPRFETEELVDRIQRMPLLGTDAPRDIIDVGTGSGCIALQLAHHFPQHRVSAVDLSEDALALAQENAAALGIESVTFRPGNLLEGVPANSFDLVVANLPYIAKETIETLEPEVRDFEPRSALDGGVAGDEMVRVLIDQACSVLRSGGVIVLEIGDEQGDPVRRYLTAAGYTDAMVWPDLNGHDRIAMGTHHA
jgi:release factor glutamine methyltransferase